MTNADFSNLAQSVKTQTQVELANFNLEPKKMASDPTDSRNNQIEKIDRLITRNDRLNDLLIVNFI